MIKNLMRLLFSGGFSREIPDDHDFFNEPSTMRPTLTAAGAKDCSTTDEIASSSTASTAYRAAARGLPGVKIHYAAPSA
ncbi:uncharacterized protein Z518_11041 [Rhinocladiella mackenziei CBS 650.93]|uniref:Uncharacterized protein n=1 Tax=Rhinocladiella mackenziei CBS 650.93 TaxID=1442369 RepID=A0A0D2I1L2_9EURO|nr:uncharacterized protein Z518_11041 [Rhinocladiella mackenziei CBS 650.93]KIW99628.1 hypothetical protein Z518_11041 [Rhinocladiella mackenziei CBS 650.93]